MYTVQQAKAISSYVVFIQSRQLHVVRTLIARIESNSEPPAATFIKVSKLRDNKKLSCSKYKFSRPQFLSASGSQCLCLSAFQHARKPSNAASAALGKVRMSGFLRGEMVHDVLQRSSFGRPNGRRVRFQVNRNSTDRTFLIGHRPVRNL